MCRRRSQSKGCACSWCLGWCQSRVLMSRTCARCGEGSADDGDGRRSTLRKATNTLCPKSVDQKKVLSAQLTLEKSEESRGKRERASKQAKERLCVGRGFCLSSSAFLLSQGMEDLTKGIFRFEFVRCQDPTLEENPLIAKRMVNLELFFPCGGEGLRRQRA